MRAVLYRILGNDLPPRHSPGQTLANLEFILQHEPRFDGLEKRWLINRVCDTGQRDALIGLLDRYGQPHEEIPFRESEYRDCWLDTGTMPEPLLPGGEIYAKVPKDQRWRALDYLRRSKNLYLVNLNGARNYSIRQGIASGAEWVMPWDGGCFLTESAWNEIASILAAPGANRFVVVPLARVANNDLLLDKNFSPTADGEPQLIFSSEAVARFDENLRYGSMNKAMLLRRLGVPGRWHEWEGGLPWEVLEDAPVAEAGKFVETGYAVRLAGAQAPGRVRTDSERWSARIAGVLAFTQQLDRASIAEKLSQRSLLCWRGLDRSRRLPESAGVLAAESALIASQRLIETVTAKPDRPQGATPNHYFSMPPYWHPDPDAPGRYRRVDGEARAETRLYAPGSGTHDRTRWQRFVDSCCALALDAYLGGNTASADQARKALVAWFVDSRTRMLPDGSFAQLTPDKWRTRHWIGAVDFRDLPALLDAITLLQRNSALETGELAAIEGWMRQWLDWLVSNPRARTAGRNANNPSTWYQYLVLSLAVWLADIPRIEATLDALPILRTRQFTADGSQPAELQRANALHYALFNLQAWKGIANVTRSIGREFWHQTDSAGRCLDVACRRLATGDSSPGGTESDAIRLAYLNGTTDLPEALLWRIWPSEPENNLADLGLPPFWQLSLPASHE